MAIHACNPSRRKNEAGRHRSPGQSELHRAILSPNKGRNKSDHEIPLSKASEHQSGKPYLALKSASISLIPTLTPPPSPTPPRPAPPLKSCNDSVQYPSIARLMAARGFRACFSLGLYCFLHRRPRSVLQASEAYPASVMPPLPVTSLFSFTHSTHSLPTPCPATSALVS